MNRTFYSFNDIINAIENGMRMAQQPQKSDRSIDNIPQSVWDYLGKPAPKAETPQEPLWNGDRAFELANDIKARRAKIEEIKKAQQAELEDEQKALEEAEKQYRAELTHIRYVGDDKQLQLLIPREKMFELVKGFTKAINDNKDAKSYKIKINL